MEYGGGYQHGEWSERPQALRGKGYYVANVLAGIDAEAAVDNDDFPEELGPSSSRNTSSPLQEGTFLEPDAPG